MLATEDFQAKWSHVEIEGGRQYFKTFTDPDGEATIVAGICEDAFAVTIRAIRGIALLCWHGNSYEDAIREATDRAHWYGGLQVVDFVSGGRA